MCKDPRITKIIKSRGFFFGPLPRFADFLLDVLVLYVPTLSKMKSNVDYRTIMWIFFDRKHHKLFPFIYEVDSINNRVNIADNWYHFGSELNTNFWSISSSRWVTLSGSHPSHSNRLTRIMFESKRGKICLEIVLCFIYQFYLHSKWCFHLWILGALLCSFTSEQMDFSSFSHRFQCCCSLSSWLNMCADCSM